MHLRNLESWPGAAVEAPPPPPIPVARDEAELLRCSDVTEKHHIGSAEKCESFCLIISARCALIAKVL